MRHIRDFYGDNSESRILMHMIEDGLQHRGEINCMLWQQDIDPPATGFIEWLKARTTAELGRPN